MRLRSQQIACITFAACLMLGLASWLAWLCLRDGSISFLPPHSRGEWIVYPKPPELALHATAELPAEFRRSFVLKQIPSSAVLEIQALKTFSLAVNDQPVALPSAAREDWKRTRMLDIAPRLKVGENTLSVVVSNSVGPPALWLRLKCDGLELVSDKSWEVSYAGAVWRPAQLAGELSPIVAGNPIYGAEKTLSSLKSRWPAVLGFVLMAALAVAGGGVWLEKKNSRGRTGRLEFAGDPVKVVGLVIAVLWIGLFLHNMSFLNRARGFDASSHLQYISYIQKHSALPSATEGWEMYQPPLYYFISAGVLKLFSISTNSFDGGVALRFMGLCIGLAHLAILFAGVRLLFPNQASKQIAGMMLGGFLPAHLYLTHYITNEILLAALVTASIYLCLRLVRAAKASARSLAGLGLCLGAALLTKVTALLVLPFIFGALAGKLIEHRQPLRIWLRTLGIPALVCFAVCSWYYMWVWMRFGSPLVGNWDTESGFSWWQDPGYHTASYYTGFGASLVNPLFSGFHGFADGIYSTLWGDGMCGGVTGLSYKPPWNYDLAAVGYLLALVPTLAITIGIIAALWRFICKPGIDGFILTGFFAIVALAMVYMSLKVTSYAQAKAFYGLSALLPLCAFGVIGWEIMTRQIKALRYIVMTLLLAWALNSYASLWIRGNSADTLASVGLALIKYGNRNGAIEKFDAALRVLPSHVAARSWLFSLLILQERFAEARQVAEEGVKVNPQSALAHLDLASMLQHERQMQPALEQVRLAVALEPDNASVRLELTRQLFLLQRYDETITACREALRLSPSDPELHLTLGCALTTQAKIVDDALAQAAVPPTSRTNPGADPEKLTRDGMAHFEFAVRLSPDTTGAMNNLAWLLATYPKRELRDGPRAVRLAERACVISQYRHPILLQTLSAAYAETGRFKEAIETSRKAIAVAEAAGQTAVAATNRKLMMYYEKGEPYHQSLPPSGENP